MTHCSWEINKQFDTGCCIIYSSRLEKLRVMKDCVQIINNQTFNRILEKKKLYVILKITLSLFMNEL